MFLVKNLLCTSSRCAEFPKKEKLFLIYKSVIENNLKKIAAIGLLLLLLYNMFGVAIAILLFENSYQTHSNTVIEDKWKIVKIPHASASKKNINEEKKGLIRSGGEFYNVMHEYQENDTLYVILKSNQNAQERYDELTSMMQGMFDPGANAPQSPLNKAMKIFGGLQKVYLANEMMLGICEQQTEQLHQPFYPEPRLSYAKVIHLLHSPPPELS